MKLPTLPMGCLSSRSTIVPSERVENTGQKTKLPSSKHPAKSTNPANGNSNPTPNEFNSRGDNGPVTNHDSNSKLHNNNRRPSVNSSTGGADDIMSILMNDQDKSRLSGDEVNDGGGAMKLDDDYKGPRARRPLVMEDRGELGLGSEHNRSIDDMGEMEKSNAEASLDEEPNHELLRQYIAIDYELSLLEDKDALRVYHEKINQLEQLEHELDMISSEVEEVAARSETGTQLEREQSISGLQSESKMMDIESNSILSGATGSMSRRSWLPNNNNNNGAQNNHQRSGNGPTGPKTDTDQQDRAHNLMATTTATPTSKKNTLAGSTAGSQMLGSSNRNFNNLSTYSTVEEVFNRKIILEKGRDKLKKEVELVIVECDRLQQKYKKRDEILDKLFDGRTGNGLENHLEQQLNWLLEQKHYVDQVFYAWKRAETLTNQTCEQFTSALELLKRLPEIESPDERTKLIKSISDLLIKSRKDIEQSQQYNPNVDAPFFTDNEMERFNTIINSISTNSISPNEYGQVMTVIQFAYKRAVSIRLWLEQILHTTIARDSFELAEEYKWIAIQLRKERINLIKSKLQSPAYQPMIQAIQEQIAREQSISDQRRQHEINRDSGIESETNDIDIEEEIYRLLELNKSRLEMATTGSNNNNNSARGGKQSQAKGEQPPSQHKPAIAGSDQNLKVTKNQLITSPSAPSSSDSNKDQKMRDRIQKRVKGGQPLHSAEVSSSSVLPPSGAISNHRLGGVNHEGQSSEANLSIGTPTRLKIELDEEAKQSLLRQVDQVHLQHKNKIERLRGNNRAKAANFLMNRMKQVRETQHQTGSEAASNGGG